MGLFKMIGSFLLGVYVGQEYGRGLPNIKLLADDLYKDFCNTNVYREFCKIEELKRKNDK